MKMILQTFFIMATIQTAFADTRIDDKTCQSIAKEESTLFSPVINASLYENYTTRRTNESLNFIERFNKNLSENYKKFCDSAKDNVTIEGLIKHQQNTCASQCDKDSEEFKPYLIGKHTLKEKSVNICKELCKKSAQKLEYLRLGTIVARDGSKQTAPDCSGSVSDKARGVDVKAIHLNFDSNPAPAQTSEK